MYKNNWGYAFILALTMTSCGGGKHTPNLPPAVDSNPALTTVAESGASPDPTATYKFYGTNTLFALDSISSTQPIEVTQGLVAGISEVQVGAVNSATNTISDIHTHALVYVEDGKIFRVSALKSSTPTPTQVSSENDAIASNLCSAKTISDWATPDRSQYIYTLAGPDASCINNADNVMKLATLEMTDTAAPIAIDLLKLITEVKDTSGAIVGYIGIDKAQNLVRTDAFFANSVVIKSSVSSAQVMARLSSRMILGIVSANIISVQNYSVDSSQLSEVALFSSADENAALSHSASDDRNVYFVITNAATRAGSLFRLPLTAVSANAAEQMAYESDGSFAQLMLSSNSVVYTWVTPQSGTFLKVVAKTVPVDTIVAGVELASAPAGNLLELRALAGSWLYYETKSENGQAAYSISEDGTGAQVHENAAWEGLLFPSEDTISTLREPLWLLLKSGDGVLMSYSASTCSLVGVMGSLDGSVVRVMRFESRGNTALIHSIGENSKNIILSLDAAVPNSLLALASPPIQLISVGQQIANSGQTGSTSPTPDKLESGSSSELFPSVPTIASPVFSDPDVTSLVPTVQHVAAPPTQMVWIGQQVTGWSPFGSMTLTSAKPDGGPSPLTDNAGPGPLLPAPVVSEFFTGGATVPEF